MPQLKNRQFLDFEKPIKELYDQIEQLKVTQEKSKTDMSGAISALEQRIVETKKHIRVTARFDLLVISSVLLYWKSFLRFSIFSYLKICLVFI